MRAYVRLLERAPPFTHPDYAAFLVLEQMLGGMFASRMNIAVRERSGASYGFHARYGASATEGTLEMETSVEPSFARSVVIAMIDEVRRMRGEGDGILRPELLLAKTRAREMLLAQVDSARGLSAAIARRVQGGDEPTAFRAVVRAIDGVDAEAIEGAARRWLRPDRATLLMVLRPEHVGAIAEAGLGRLRLLSFAR